MKFWFIISLFLLSNGEVPAEKNNVREITIVDRQGRVVNSIIECNDEELGETDSNGKYTLPKECNPGDDYFILPTSGLYKGKKFKCPNSQSKYVLHTKEESSLVQKNAFLIEFYTDLIQKDSNNVNPDFDKKRIAAISALSSNEFYVYYGLNGIDKKEEAESARINTIKCTAKFLEIDTPLWIDPNNNRAEASTELIEKLKIWQQENNLDPDGEIDGRTLQKMAKASSNAVYNIDFSEKVQEQL